MSRGMHLLAEAINERLMYPEDLRINCINSVKNPPLFSFYAVLRLYGYLSPSG